MNVTMTADLSTSLIHLLREELDAYRRLADLLERQRQFIVQRSLEEIQQSTAEEESLIHQTEQLGDARTAVVQALAQSLGMQNASPLHQSTGSIHPLLHQSTGSIHHPLTLSDLFPFLDTDTVADLTTLREDLVNLVRTINDLTATNQFLMTHALRMTAKRLAILEGIDDGDIVYAQTGRRDPADQTTLKVIDRKI